MRECVYAFASERGVAHARCRHALRIRAAAAAAAADFWAGGVWQDAVEAMRISLGATRVLQHTLQGLFHPARKVREVYWKVYNNLYIGSQVPFPPRCYPRALRSEPLSGAKERRTAVRGARLCRRWCCICRC